MNNVFTVTSNHHVSIDWTSYFKRINSVQWTYLKCVKSSINNRHITKLKQEPISCRADNALAASCQSFAARWACVLKRPIFYLAAYIDNNVSFNHTVSIFSPLWLRETIIWISRTLTEYQWNGKQTNNCRWWLCINKEDFYPLMSFWSLPSAVHSLEKILKQTRKKEARLLIKKQFTLGTLQSETIAV